MNCQFSLQFVLVLSHAYLLPAACQFASMQAGKSVVLKNIYLIANHTGKNSASIHLCFIILGNK
jgi:hypothetical protein